MSSAANITFAIVAAASTAFADPFEPRLLTAPTAWLPEANGGIAAVGLDMRGQASIDGDFGIGGIGELELGLDSDARACSTSPCGTSNGEMLADALHLVRAGFRVGARQDAWFVGQPAVVVGVRETIGGVHAIGEAYVVASRELGPLRLHAGIDALASSEVVASHGFPLGGIEYTPPRFPKTTLMADIAWQPIFGDAIAFERILGVGVRYRTFSWLTVELDYRAREDESLAGSTVSARIVGHWPK